MPKTQKVKYYLTSSKGQTIKMEAKKHPILWSFLAKNWDELCEEYEKVKKEKRIYNMILSGNVPEMKFDDKNWELIEKETRLKGAYIKLGIDSPDAVLVYLRHDPLHRKI